jgi:hypothetical protein
LELWFLIGMPGDLVGLHDSYQSHQLGLVGDGLECAESFVAEGKYEYTLLSLNLGATVEIYLKGVALILFFNLSSRK